MQAQAIADHPMQPWHSLALALPGHHSAVSAGEHAAFLTALVGLPALDARALPELDEASLRLIGLDILMLEAFCRRHALDPSGSPLDASVIMASEQLGLQPIISYPLYIRQNPSAFGQTRRFTPYDAEFRFIRMHAAIEDVFDDMIGRLETAIDAPDPAQALMEHGAALCEGLRAANRIMSGFRSPIRMPHDDFFDGFRPYYDARCDPATGELELDGPSGLQSYTYRIIAMLLGYRDRVMDGWTQRIGRYHEPAVRERLSSVLARRDAGRSVAGRICDKLLEPDRDLPHLHPDYGSDIPLLLQIAQAGDYLAPDVLATIESFDLELGEWPGELAERPALPELTGWRSAAGQDFEILRLLAELEAGLMAMHLEHVATAAHQIGAVRGTGGTSGVEFLLIATFRRAFPALWRSGLGRQLLPTA